MDVVDPLPWQMPFVAEDRFIVVKHENSKHIEIFKCPFISDMYKMTHDLCKKDPFVEFHAFMTEAPDWLKFDYNCNTGKGRWSNTYTHLIPNTVRMAIILAG